MPTIIDSFVVEFALDPAKFTSGQQKAVDDMRRLEEQARKNADNTEKQTKRIGDLIGGIRREALTMLGVFLGGKGIAEFTQWMTNLEAGTGRLAVQLGDDTKQVSIWQGAVKQAGGSVESAAGALAGLNRAVTQFSVAGGEPDWLGVFSRLNVSLYDQNHQLKTATQLWLELAAAVEKMDKRTAATFLQNVPGANADMINLLLLGPQKVREMLAEQEKALKVTNDQSKAAQELQHQWSLTYDAIVGVGKAMLDYVSPILDALLIKMRQFIPASKDTPDRRAAATSMEVARDVAVQSVLSVSPKGIMDLIFGPNWFGPHWTADLWGDDKSAAKGAKDTGSLNPSNWVGADFGDGRGLTFAPGARAAAGGRVWNSRVSNRGGDRSTTVTVGKIDVNAPHATDADGIGREIGGSIDRAVQAGAANNGPQ